MSGKVIEGAKATVTISYTDGKTRTFDLTSVSFDERLPADGSYPAFFLEGKVTGRALRANYTKSKLPDIDVDPAQDPRRRIGMGIGYGAKVVAEAMQVMRSAAANDPARRADAIAALNRYWPEWHLTDPEILGFRGGFPRGNNTVLYGPAAKPKAPPEAQQEIADERTRLKQSFWTIVGPSYPTVPLKPEHRVSYPTPHKTCTCDIKDLMSTGHLTGCPEKKR